MSHYFGYEFNSSVSGIIKTKFLNMLKGVSEDQKISELDLKKFLTKPILLLGSKVFKRKLFGHDKGSNPNNGINCIIYPQSKGPNLNRTIIGFLHSFATTENYLTLNLIKDIRENISFDYESLKEHCVHNYQYKEMKTNADCLIKSIKEGEGDFSLSREVKTKYRQLIRDFIIFEDKNHEKIWNSIKDKCVLIIDDIKTTQGTINQIIRLVNNYFPRDITIFTLIGKE
jgi:hypothetical protein